MKFLLAFFLIMLLSVASYSLEKEISEKNKESEIKIKEFISQIESKNDLESSKLVKADKSYVFSNVKIKDEHVLIYSIKNKMLKTSEALIKRGSNLNHKDKDGKVAIMYAAEAKNRYLVTMIKASKADLKIKDNAGISAEEYLKINRIN